MSDFLMITREDGGFGHTIAGLVFGEWGKVWMRGDVIGVDTGAYLYGILSGIELPSRRVFRVSEEIEMTNSENPGQAGYGE
jgi:hypothetical protein